MNVKKITIWSIVLTLLSSWFLYITNFLDHKSVDNVVAVSTDLSIQDNTKILQLYLNRINELETKVTKSALQQQAILEKLNTIITDRNSNNGTPLVTTNRAENTVETTATAEARVNKQINQEQCYFDNLENNFQIEPVDEAWSANQEQHIRNLLETEKLNQAMINTIDCRSKTCRADIIHTDRKNAEKFMEQFMRSFSGTSGELRFENNANGGVDTVIYLSKN